MKFSSRNKRFKLRFLTLVEVMVASFILTMALVAMMSAAVMARYMVFETRIDLEAQRYAFDRSQEVANLSFEDLKNYKFHVNFLDGLELQKISRPSSSFFVGPKLTQFGDAAYYTSVSPKTADCYSITTVMFYPFRRYTGYTKNKRAVSVLYRYRRLSDEK